MALELDLEHAGQVMATRAARSTGAGWSDPLSRSISAPLVAVGPPVPTARSHSPTAPPSGTTLRRATLPGATYDELEASNRILLWRVSRTPVILILGWFTLSHLALGAVWVFIDNVNLVFHEAGHFLFSWGGDTITALGGTLAQLLLPAGLAVYFWLRQRNRYAALVCVWWAGENLIGVGRYMADAAFEELALIGGDIHDWNFLFGRWNLLSSGQEIGSASRWIGAIVMIAALVPLVLWTARPSAADLRRDADAAIT